MSQASKIDQKSVQTTAIDSNKVNVVAQELKFARLLSGNDPKTRNTVLKNLKKWLKTRSLSNFQFTHKEFMRLWKGLFYCMWMSDKPLVQEELAEQLGSLIHCFPDVQVGLQFYQTFLDTMIIEWDKLDQWRMDKFMMLVRRVHRQALFVLKNTEWSDETIKQYQDILEKSILKVDRCPIGLVMHITDLYLEELSKVSEGEISEEKVHMLLEPFMVYLAKINNPALFNHIEKSIFNQLLFQSDLGQEFEEKFDIWKQANFPTESIDDIEIKYKIQKVNQINDDDLSNGEEEDEEDRVLDPRAGKVNVTLAEIKFDGLKIAETLENLRYKAFATTKSRKQLATLANKYRRYIDGEFPLGVKTMPIVHDEEKIDLDLKAMELAEFEKKLALGDADSDSEYDADLENRKKGKLKRKTGNDVMKVKQKKPKLSKLHNSRFFNDKLGDNAWEVEDFTKDTQDVEDEKDEEPEKQPKEMKMKKVKQLDEEPAVAVKKLKIRKDKQRKSLPNVKLLEDQEKPTTSTRPIEEVDEQIDKPKKSMKTSEQSTPTTSAAIKDESPKSSGPFSIEDEWSQPLKDGEIELFVPSRKHKVKEANKELSGETSGNLVRNPFAGAGSSGTIKKTPAKIQMMNEMDGTPQSAGKRVVIALNRNKAQHPHEYIKQVKESPNLPYDSTKKPTKSLLKPHVLPSPINPFYQKKIGLKLNMNDTL